MLTIVAGLMLGVLMGFCIIKIRKTKEEKGVILLLCSVVGLVGGFVACGVVSSYLPRKTVVLETEKAEIVALIGSSETEGQFFLASGVIESQDYYKFYCKAADGAKIFMKLAKQSAKIYEEERGDAYIVKLQEEETVTRKSLWAIAGLVNRTIDREYAIHVPKGSIKSEIDLSLK